MDEGVLLGAAMLLGVSSLAAAAVAWVFVRSASPQAPQADAEG